MKRQTMKRTWIVPRFNPMQSSIQTYNKEVIISFVKEVCIEAEQTMLKTGKLEGAHYNAMKQICKENGIAFPHEQK
jgi:hypothetical protein